MGKLIYLMNVSLDGYVEGPDGKFGWSRPDEEVHRFHNQIAGDLGRIPIRSPHVRDDGRLGNTGSGPVDARTMSREFAQIWRSKPKVVFSRTLRTVGPNCTLVGQDIEVEVRTLKQQSRNDVSVSGPGLASTCAKLGLIDEYRLVVFPTMVGGGKSYFPRADQAIQLRLMETRSFKCGAVYLRYQLS